MELQFDQNTIDLFSYILRYNVSTYIDLYSIFIQENQPLILQYYQEQNVNPDAASFDFLEKLIIEAKKIDNLVKIHKSSFKTIDQWELLYFIEEIRYKLDTIKNTSKWIGSSKSKNSWQSTSIQIDYTLSQNETLEEVNTDIYGENVDQDGWIDIAMKNDLLEKDYDTNGGTKIQLSKQTSSTSNFNVRTVIDTLVNEKLYGLDIDKSFKFKNDDLNVLSYNDTIVQAINILILLKKGDVPEFPGFGLDANIGAGGNISSFYYTSLSRQLDKIFSTDDTLRNLTITKIDYDNGDIIIYYNIDTMYNLSYNNLNTTLIAN